MARLPQLGDESWGETLNQYLLVAHTPEGTLKSAALTAADQHTFHVATYGALGDGQADDAAAIQAALDDIATTAPGARLSFAPGTYLVSDELEIKSAVHLDLSDGAIIRRTNPGAKCIFKNFNATYAPLGYAGRSDITISGGVLDANGEQLDGNVSAIVIAHAQRVTVAHVTVRNVRARHAIEYSAVQQGAIRDCTFEGFLPGDAGSYASEAVQIDGAFNALGLPDIGPAAIDNTPCQSITMRGCISRGYGSLKSYGRMVGSPFGVDGVWHSAIRISANYAEGMSDYAVRAINWIDAVVEGNTFEDGNGGIAFLTSSTAVTGSERIIISQNIFRNHGTNTVAAPAASGVITVAGLDKSPLVLLREVIITGNIIKGFAATVAIECVAVSNLVCTHNIIKATAVAAQTGISLTACASSIVTANRCDGGMSKAALVVIAGQTGAGSDGTVITGNAYTECGPVLLEAPSSVVSGNSFFNPISIGLLIGGSAAYSAITGNTFAKTAGSATNAIEVRTATALIQTNAIRGWGKEGTAGTIRRNAVLSPNMATGTNSTTNLNRYS